MTRDAVFSDCGTYRYALSRRWDDRLGAATFIMLNPSTADAATDDPTIRRCVGFARRWGLGAVQVHNLYALRATDPRELWNHQDPIGPDNNAALRAAGAGAALLVCAWGACARAERRAGEVLGLLTAGITSGVWVLHCVGITGSGAPRHPLYAPYGDPIPWAASWPR